MSSRMVRLSNHVFGQAKGALGVIGWYHAPISARITMAVAYAAAVCVGITAFLGINAFTRDREILIAERTWMQSELALEQSIDALHAIHAEPSEILPASEEQMEELGLPNPPQEHEAFAAEFPSGWRMVRKRNGRMISIPLPPMEKICPAFAGFCTLLTHSGKLVATSHPQQITSKNFATRPALKEYLDTGVASGFRFIGGSAMERRTAAGYRELRDTNLVLVTEQYADAVFRPLRSQILNSLGLVVLTVLAMILIVVAVLNPILKPLRTMNEIVRNLAQGKVPPAVNVEYHDEVGAVTLALSRATEMMGQRQRQLKGFQKNLAGMLNFSLAMGQSESEQELSRTMLKALHTQIFKEQRLACGAIPVESSGLEPLYLLFDERSPSGRPVSKEEILRYRLTLESGEETQMRAAKNHDRVLVQLGNTPMATLTLHLLDSAMTALSVEQKHFLDNLCMTYAALLDNLVKRKKMLDVARLDWELETAKVVQSSLLSERTYTHRNYGFKAHYRPAEQVGGDWYSILRLPDENRLVVVVADVVGHGIPAALLTSLAYGVLHSACHSVVGLQGEALLRHMATTLNSVLLSTNDSHNVMTALLVEINTVTHECTVLGAGHPHPLHFQAAAARVNSITISGSLVGITPVPEYTVKSFPMECGDKLLMFTDGLIENTSAAKEELTRKKLKEAFCAAAQAGGSAGELMASADAVWKGHPGKDDVTVVVFERLPDT